MINTKTAKMIGALASEADVNIQTIRYYERRGLLPNPERTASNYRVYGPGTAQRVKFIKRAQELGFTLAEIQELLELRAEPDARCEDVCNRSRVKIRDIEEKIRSLESIKAALGKLIGSCSNEGPVAGCHILNSMNGERVD